MQFKKHRREITRMAATAGNKHTEAVVRRAAGRVIVADVPLKGLVAALDPGIAPHVAGAHAGRLGRVDSNSTDCDTSISENASGARRTCRTDYNGRKSSRLKRTEGRNRNDQGRTIAEWH